MGLLLGSRACPECEAAMTLQARARSADGYSWRCAVWMTREVPKRKPVKVQCRGEVSVRSGSFFEGSHLTLLQLMRVICLWCRNLPCAVIRWGTGVAGGTMTDWASFCREVVVNAVFTHSGMIGGEGVTVELDESMFGRRKYHRGYLRPGQWVFGGVERGSGCCFLVPVETCDAKIPARANSRVGPPWNKNNH
uniref:Putative transposase-like protein n=1 Tax=Ixodes ricinus TaxID=34613 RepID=A0A6B0V1L8_IXORI